jgi:hypothetical protein
MYGGKGASSVGYRKQKASLAFVKSFNSVVSVGHAPVDVELAGVSVTMDVIVGCNVSTGNDVSVVCEHAESIMNSRIVPMNLCIIFNDL